MNKTPEGGTRAPIELDLAESRIQDLRDLISGVRSDIRELYSMRGEDELVAKFCRSILSRTEDA